MDGGRPQGEEEFAIEERLTRQVPECGKTSSVPNGGEIIKQSQDCEAKSSKTDKNSASEMLFPGTDEERPVLEEQNDAKMLSERNVNQIEIRVRNGEQSKSEDNELPTLQEAAERSKCNPEEDETLYEGVILQENGPEAIEEEEMAAQEGSSGSYFKEERSKEKVTMSHKLRSSFEKRAEMVEKMLGNHVERILEDKVERHPWLQPIETWLSDHCRSSSPSPSSSGILVPENSKGYNSDSEFNFKPKQARGSPKPDVETEGSSDNKFERKVIEQLKRLGRSGSPRSDKAEKDAKSSDRLKETNQERLLVKFKVDSSKTESEIGGDVKIERRLVEHFKRVRRGGSPKLEPKNSPVTYEGSSDSMIKSESNKNKSFLHAGEKDMQMTRSLTLPETPAPPETLTVFQHSSTPPPSIATMVEANEVEDTKNHTQEFIERLKEGFKEKKEELHRYFQRTSRLADVNRKLKSQIWSSVVTIVLVEAKNLLPMDIEGLSDPYVKFRLGTEKYKSKVVNKTLNAVWLEQFDLHLYEDPFLGQELEVTVWDRDRAHQDDLMGRTVIDLATLERETTHRIWRDLEDGAGSIFLLLTISGTTASETISDLAAHEETLQERAQLIQKYCIFNTLQRPKDVGHLTVKVYRAQGLAAADLGGKSDPFCVLELVNSRLQTQTEYKTLAPNWQKIFTFNVKDINSVLEVTVYDEDRDHKVEFLGKVAIPLLRIHNGEKRWYALKDKKLRGRAKGNCPQILLEMTVLWNPLRACFRTLNPRETKYMEPEIKFKRQVFLRNVLRLKAIILVFIDLSKYIRSCWEWESKPRSIISFVLFMLGCFYFEPYMIPTAAFLILFRYYMCKNHGDSCTTRWICGQVVAVTGSTHHQHAFHLQDQSDPTTDDCPPTPGDDDDDDDDKDKEEKKSLKERLQAIQEVTQTVQNSIGYIASLGERVKNTFNFTVPYLSYVAIALSVVGIVVLYFIPIRYLLMIWGVNKFSRKILRPHSVPNNELLDLLSRVPDDEELLNYRELKSVPTADCERGGSTSSGTGSAGRREQRKKHKA